MHYLMNNINRSWLKLGVIALAISGLYSIILVFLRTPQLSQFFSDKSMFRSALIVHVNLSVLVWLLSVTASTWIAEQRKYPYLNIITVSAAALGMILMALGPAFGHGEPIMNNYVPILNNLTFVLGLSLYIVALLSSAVLIISYIIFNAFNNKSISCAKKFISHLFLSPQAPADQNLFFLVRNSSIILFFMACGCFYRSSTEMQQLANTISLQIDYYYEMLFWSAGHLLQYIYTQVWMLVLLALAVDFKTQLRFQNIYYRLLQLNFWLACTVLFGHLLYHIGDAGFKWYFTQQMIAAGGLAPAIFIIVLLFDLWVQLKNAVISSSMTATVSKIAFIAAISLFAFGGIIGILISGVNVSIPAHYHGAIVGITIGFMGFVYMLYLEGFRDIKLAKIQIYIFVTGQFLHILGLALAGGYGVMRKDPNGAITLKAKLYMGMVGGGGLLAIIGGLMFVYICGKNMFFYQRSK